MAEEIWVKCRNCAAADPTERDGSKWYCTFRKIYIDPDKPFIYPEGCKYYEE